MEQLDKVKVAAREGALDMARRGFKVFPCLPGDKPCFSWSDPNERNCSDKDRHLAGGINKGTSDPAVIEAWFAHKLDPDFGYLSLDINYGVAATGLCIVDYDVKKDPLAAVEELISLGELPQTFTVRTPSNGNHYYFGPADVGQRKLSPNIDIRSRNGYVVGPGSIIAEHGNRDYEIVIDHKLAGVPDRISTRLARAPEKDEDAGTAICEMDTDTAIEAAVAFLSREGGIEDGNRGNAAFVLACHLKDLGLSASKIFDVLDEHWNHKNFPPIEDGRLAQIADNAHKNSRHAAGSSNPDLEFGDMPGILAEIFPPLRVEDLLEFPSDVSLEALAERQKNALIAGVLHRGEAATLYAPTTAGKTFVALDLCWHLAMRKDWHGMRVKGGPVLYVMLEGVGGFHKRMLAAKKMLGDTGKFFARLKLHVTLDKTKNGEQGVKDILKAADALEQVCGEPVALIVIDTFARAVAGDDENAAAEMMGYLEKRIGRITAKTGAATLTVHHPGKSGSYRGSSAGPGGYDVILRIDRSGLRRTLVAEKIKDDAEKALFDFRLEVVDIGDAGTGTPVTSCVVRTSPPTGGLKPPQPQAIMPAGEGMLRSVFAELLAKEPGLATGPFDVSLPIARAREAFCLRHSRGTDDNDKDAMAKAKESASRAWRRIMQDLPSGFSVQDGVISLARELSTST